MNVVVEGRIVFGKVDVSRDDVRVLGDIVDATSWKKRYVLGAIALEDCFELVNASVP